MMLKFNVLSVDDEPDQREIVRRFREETRGFFVDINTGAPPPLLFIGTQPYDAIIPDYRMPKMDGIAL